MSGNRKGINIEIGKRLREARKRLGYKQAEFAAALDVTEEHYRKYELGSVGLSAEKLTLLFEKFGLNPTYIVTGKNDEEFDFESYIAGCDAAQRSAFLNRVFEYMIKLMETVE